MLFVIIGQDKPNGLEHRMKIRPSHLMHLDSLGDKVVLGGPFLDGNGKSCGSLVVIEAASLEAAQAIAAADPFVQQGVFATHEVKRWTWGINNPEGRGQ